MQKSRIFLSLWTHTQIPLNELRTLSRSLMIAQKLTEQSEAAILVYER